MFYFIVSVPIRGLFNLTVNTENFILKMCLSVVSVPIRGLFNLTTTIKKSTAKRVVSKFPSPSGDYLI